ncbi:MAG: transcription elongation factor GreA [Anaerolineae bacterium]|nr:transcription elongation factor GreA [Anaerolineae bacterium]
MSDQVYLTREGKQKLEIELKELTEVRRPALAAQLKEAIAQGDLRENADYHDAKEQQAFLEGRIREIESTLKLAVLIDEENNSKGRVVIGSAVTVVEDGEDTQETYRIVGAAEANPAQGRISNESPLGQALLSRKKGDRVRVHTPNGQTVFKIMDVK